MTADHLLGHPPHYGVDAESAPLPGDVRVKDHLQEKVAQLAGQRVVVLEVDGLGHFVGFFDGHGLDARMGLLAVPGTSPRGAQARDQANEVLEEAARVDGRGFHGPMIDEGSTWISGGCGASAPR
jgi:hypothetical protein